MGYEIVQHILTYINTCSAYLILTNYLTPLSMRSSKCQQQTPRRSQKLIFKQFAESHPEDFHNDEIPDNELEAKSRIIYAKEILGWSLISISAYFSISKDKIMNIMNEFYKITKARNVNNK